MKYLILFFACLLPCCQRQEAIANTGNEPDTQGQLDGPYGECLCDEVHALNQKVDKLLELLDCLCKEEVK